jgi:hypothetical protein
MANERVEGREQVGEAIGVLFAASRDSVVWAVRSAGEIQIDSIAISRKIASSAIKSVGEVAVEAFDVWEQATKKALQTSRTLGQEAGATVKLLVRDLPVGVIEVVRHVLTSASDAVKGGIREAADIGTIAAASVSRVAHESTQATQRVAGDVTGAARAGIGGAIEVSRAAGATGVRAAREVLGGIVDGARGIGNIRPLRLRVAAPSSPRVAGRGRRRAASEGAAS